MAIIRSTASSFGGGAKSSAAALQTAQNNTVRTQQGIAAQQQQAMRQAASNAQAAKIYQSSAPFLSPTYFTGVGSVTVKSGGGGGGTGQGVTGPGNGNDLTLTGGGTNIETQPPPPAPKPPTAGELGVVKTPGRDVTRISDLVQQTPADTIKRIAFEQLSAIELSQIVTSNTVDGINQRYSIVSNLSDIKTRFDASKQLSVMNKATPMTGVYNIDIDSKIPGESYLLANNLYAEMSYKDVDGTTVTTVEKGNIYIDTNGDLVIEFDNMRDDEIIQIQINADGTIYEVNNDN